MTKKVIHIDDEAVVNKLEALSYEIQARKDLLSYMIQQDVNISESNAFKEYHAEYQKFVKDYEIAKRDFEVNFIRPTLADNQKVSWNLDFHTHDCTLTGIDE